MKVTFTCEECGATVYVGDCIETGAELDAVLDIMAKNKVGLPSCPNCAKLTYGPLTEEMMAEALCECSNRHCDTEDDYYECEARFVLRLLIDGGLANDKPTVTHGCTAEDWRDWLLGMARQK